MNILNDVSKHLGDFGLARAVGAVNAESGFGFRPNPEDFHPVAADQEVLHCGFGANLVKGVPLILFMLPAVNLF